jgi:methionine aminotransferase
MSSLAAAHNAINLGQGFPDFPMNPELISLVNEAMRNGWNQYTHMAGYLPLREAIARKVQFLYNTELNAETDITVTPGGTYALYTALTTILQRGDEVILFEPAYDSYLPAIEVNNAIAVPIALSFPHYTIDWAFVKTKITERTKAIIINTPHNPTGTLLSKDDIVELKKIVAGTNIFIISDEVYEHLVFDGLEHNSILLHPDLLNRSFVAFSFGKNYHCTGWKLGYCISSPFLMSEFRKVHQYNSFSCDTPKQVALSHFIGIKEHYLELGNELQQKRDYFRALLSTTNLKPLPSHGSYFQCYSFGDISDEKEKDFAIRITQQYGVTAIPVSAFYKNATDNKVIRFCFAKQDATLEEAARRLSTLR